MESKIDPQSSSYWHAILDLVHLDDACYENGVAKFIHQQYKSSQFEHLTIKSDYKLFSFRLNDSDRVLCTEINVNEKNYLLILEHVPNHDYDKARFRQKGVLSQYIKLNYQLFADYIGNQEKLAQQTPSCKKEAITYKRISFHQEKVISLSEEQQSILFEEKHKALLVSGGPGSGKTLLAIEDIRQELQKDKGKINQERLLYVTESLQLARKMRAEFDAKQYPNPYGKEVSICSYRSLLLEKGIIHSEDDLVDKKYFINFMQTYLKQAIHKQNDTLERLRKQANYKDDSKLIELIYQELRILSGFEEEYYLSKDKYVQSLFLDYGHRAWLNKVYFDYCEHLIKEKKIHPAFCMVSKDAMGIYDKIWVDEAQDLSHLQLKILYQACENGQILYLNDPNQILDDHLTKTRFLKELCQEQAFAQYLLSGSFRCPKEVIRLANAVLKLKFILTGGVLDKKQQAELELTLEQLSQQSDNTSSLDWYDSLEDIPEKEDLLAKIKGSAKVAIVTLPEYKDEAIKKFNTVSVFTPDEIKGLEFDYVVAYQLLDDPIYAKASKDSAMEGLSNKKTPKHRPKEGKEQPEYSPVLNRLFTAFTRCTKHLTVIQSTGHKIEPVVNYFKNSINSELKTNLSTIVSSLEKDSYETWLNRAEENLEKNEDYARAIFIRELGKTEEDFMAWKKEKSKIEPKLSVAKALPPQELPVISKKSIQKQPSPAPQTKKQEKKSANIVSPAKNPIKTQLVNNPQKKMTVFEKIDEAILTNNKDFIKTIIRSITAEQLHYLLSQKKGLDLFDVALSKNDKLGIKIESLFNLVINKENPVEALPALYYWLSSDKNASFYELLKNNKFLNACAKYKGLATVLFAKNNRLGTSALYYLLAHEYGNILIKKSLGENAFIKEKDKQREAIIATYMDSLFACIDERYQSIFSRCFESLEGLNVLKTFLAIPGFKDKLIHHPQFKHALLSKTDLCSPFEMAMIRNESQQLLQGLLEDEVITNLSSQDLFIDCIFSSNPGIFVDHPDFSMCFHWLIGTVFGLEIFQKLILNAAFINKFAARADLIEVLLTQFKNPNKGTATCPFWIILNLPNFEKFFSNAVFLKNLYSHPLFYKYFFAKQTREDLYGYGDSLFVHLLTKDAGKAIFAELCEYQAFIDFAIENNSFIDTLMDAFKNPPHQDKSILARIIFSASAVKGFIKLCSNPHFLEKLKAHPELIETFFLTNGRHESVINKFLTFGGGGVIETLCEDESFATAFFEHEDAFDAIVAIPVDNNVSALTQLSLHPNVLVKCITSYSQEHLSAKLGYPWFLQAFLVPCKDANSAIISALTAHPLGVNCLVRLYDHSQFLQGFFTLQGLWALKLFIAIPGFKEKLTTHPQFEKWFLSKSISHKSGGLHSPFEVAVTITEVRGVLPLLLDNEIITALSLHDCFVDCFFSLLPENPPDYQRLFHCLILLEHGIPLLKHLSLNASLMNKFIARPEFIEVLFYQYQTLFKGAPTCAFWNFFNPPLFQAFFNNPLFLNKLYSHPLFYKYFFVKQTNPDLFLYGESLFLQFLKPCTEVMLTNLCTHPEFINFANNNTHFVDALMDTYKQGALQDKVLLAAIIDSRFAKAFVKLSSNQPFLERLKAHPEFINQCFKIDNKHISLINRLLGSGGVVMLETLCADEIFAKTFFEHDEALDAILAQPDNDFSCLARLAYIPNVLEKILKTYSQDNLIDKLRNHEGFIPHLIQTYAYGTYKSSFLNRLMQKEQGLLFFIKLCESESFCEKLFNHKQFLDELLYVYEANNRALTPLLRLLSLERGCIIFGKICEDSLFFSNLVNHPNFIKALSVQVVVCNQLGISILSFLNLVQEGQSILEKLCDESQFIQALKNNPEFMETCSTSLLSKLGTSESGKRLLTLLDLLPKPENLAFQFFAKKLDNDEEEKSSIEPDQNII